VHRLLARARSPLLIALFGVAGLSAVTWVALAAAFDEKPQQAAVGRLEVVVDPSIACTSTLRVGDNPDGLMYFSRTHVAATRAADGGLRIDLRAENSEIAYVCSLHLDDASTGIGAEASASILGVQGQVWPYVTMRGSVRISAPTIASVVHQALVLRCDLTGSVSGSDGSRSFCIRVTDDDLR
jgi:hypothetical protein